MNEVTTYHDMYAPSCDVDYVKMAFFIFDNDEGLEQYASNSFLSIFLF